MMEFINNAKSNVKIFIFYTFSIAIIVMLHIRNGVYIGQVRCVADGYIFTSVYWFFGIEIGILTNLIILNFFKNDFKSFRVLKQTSRWSLWVKQAIGSCVIAILASIWISICTFLASGLMSQSYINWDSVNSIYYAMNNVTCTTLDLKEVIHLFVINSSIRILIIALISLFLYWVTNSKIVSWLIIIGLGVIEISIPIIYRRISIGYENINNLHKFTNNHLLGLGLVVILLVLGIIFGKRKEFYGQ